MPAPNSPQRWTCPDHNNNPVVLHEEQWKHIILGHVEMLEHESCISRVILEPDMVIRTEHSPRYPGGERHTFCKFGAHPDHSSLHVLVPIEYCPDGHNFVVTAYLGYQPPNGDLIYVQLPS